MNLSEELKSSLVKDVHEDFERRREMRRGLEAKWLLNINYMLGNQQSFISPTGEILDNDKRFYWQESEVFNHIAPIIENRLAKFTRVNCSVNVRPASSSDNDINVAKLSNKLIDTAKFENNFVDLQNAANYWMELTGTAFYKVFWGKSGVNCVGNEQKTQSEGDVKIAVCPPYEIYPDTLGACDVDACLSIIHAKAYPVEIIEDTWGVKIEGGEVSVINMDDFGKTIINPIKAAPKTKGGYAIVIERYHAPTKESPNGRLTIVAGNELLFNGELPYKNKNDGQRGFPFIRQVAFLRPASFFGMSIIERLIPVQRAYNAVKNRKHEFLNRLTTGVVAVEEGSVDVEALEEEGLSPGKVVLYRQGSRPPMLMSAGSVPADFRDEENRLLNEFVSVSGVSNYASQSMISQNSVSGYALSLLLEQDYNRLSVTTESIRNAVRLLSKQILRLYMQFSNSKRVVKIADENGILEIKYFKGSELTSDDIVMEADSEMIETPAVRRSMVMDLLRNGLLSDENGKINNRNRLKILEMLGFGNWENAKSNEEAHLKKAAIENERLSGGIKVETEEVDDHDIHIGEHIRAIVLGNDTFSDKVKNLINAHIKEHKNLRRLAKKAESFNGI